MGPNEQVEEFRCHGARFKNSLQNIKRILHCVILIIAI